MQRSLGPSCCRGGTRRTSGPLRAVLLSLLLAGAKAFGVIGAPRLGFAGGTGGVIARRGATGGIRPRVGGAVSLSGGGVGVRSRARPGLLGMAMQDGRTESDVDEASKAGPQDSLKKELAERSWLVSPEDEKKADIGISQFVGSPFDRGVGGAPPPLKKEDVGTVVADFTNSKMSLPRLLWSRGADAIEDLIDPIGKPMVRSREDKARSGRKKLVVLGSGWGAHALLKTLDANKYDVQIVSPRNYFVFTPMLAGAATGTVELRSITESIRSANVGADYLEATAMEIDPERKTISCEAVVCDGGQCSISEFSVPYDMLVVGVGASVNTFGIKGVRDHCFFLKQISDAAALRAAIGNTFERANLPGMSDEERVKTLTFVVVGAGPTGIEFTAELRDFIEQDLPKFYPDLLQFVRIRVLEASDRVLMQFRESMQAKAVDNIERSAPAVPGLLPDYTKVLLQSAVNEVTQDTITLNDGTVLPYGIAVWAAGIGPLPVTLDLIKKIPECAENEMARGRLVTDRWMRVAGTGGAVLAIGDCAFVKDSPLPATAQVAAQQGSYLGRLLSRGYDFAEAVPTKTDGEASKSARAGMARPFQFLNLGILAYTGGNSALAQVQLDDVKVTDQAGAVGWLAWRSVYLAKQVSWKNQVSVLFDWAKTSLFGRDITRF